MRCPQCGKTLDDRAVQCPKCKTRFNMQPPNPQPQVQQRQAPMQQYASPAQQLLQTQQMQMQMQAQQLQMQQQALNMQAQQMQSMARCPRCGSTSLSGNKKGYGVVKGAVGAGLGALICAPVAILGLAAGNMGAKKVRVTCMNCGCQFKP